MDRIAVSSNGYNPMRYDCQRDGCFNKKHRPKLEQFAECFPGRVNFGDVDGLVEMGGHFLVLEWKSGPMEIPLGQRLTYAAMIDTGRFTVFLVAGNAETMEVTHYAVMSAKSPAPTWVEGGLDKVKQLMTIWAQRHRRQM